MNLVIALDDPSFVMPIAIVVRPAMARQFLLPPPVSMF